MSIILLCFLFLIILIVTAGVIILIVLLSKKKGNELSLQDMGNRVNNAAQTGAQKNSTMFCHACGTQIDSDSQFCKKCGTNVSNLQ